MALSEEDSRTPRYWCRAWGAFPTIGRGSMRAVRGTDRMRSMTFQPNCWPRRTAWPAWSMTSGDPGVVRDLPGCPTDEANSVRSINPSAMRLGARRTWSARLASRSCTDPLPAPAAAALHRSARRGLRMSAGKLPARADEVAGLAVGMFPEIILLVLFRLPEWSSWADLGNHLSRPQARSVDVGNWCREPPLSAPLGRGRWRNERRCPLRCPGG